MPRLLIGPEKFLLMQLDRKVILIQIQTKIVLELVAQSVEDKVKVKISNMGLKITKILRFQDLNKTVLISNLNGLKAMRLSL